MNVLHIINNLKREGAQVVLRNLIRCTQDQESDAGRIRHHVFSRAPDGELNQELEQCGVRVFSPDRYYGTLQTGRSLEIIESIIDENDIDIIQAHMPDAACLGWLASKRRSMDRLILTYHGHNIVLQCSIICRLYYYYCLFRASRFARFNITVSDTVATTASRMLKLDLERFMVITNGVPVPTTEQIEHRSDRRSSPERVRIICVGRLIELKGHWQLVDAAIRLIEQGRDIEVVFLGEGELRESLQSRVDVAGVGDRIALPGNVADVTTWLLEADIYITTSYTEGLPMATLEAMACGLPVVASDIDGNREVIRDGETGVLFRTDDIAGLAENIERLIDEPEHARRLGENARALVEASYSEQRTADRYADVYQHLMRSGQR